LVSDRREEDRRSETAATVPSTSDARNEERRVEGLGGGFRYCGLGEPLFDESGKIRGTVRFSDLAAHVFFTETGTPIPTRATGKNPLLGEHNGKAIYLLFNGVMGDKTVNGGNVLTSEILKRLPEPARRSETAVVASISDRREDNRRSETAAVASISDRREEDRRSETAAVASISDRREEDRRSETAATAKVVYGEGCRLGESRLKREGVVFKQIPYAIKVS
jgi:hypothetical protein